MLIQIVEVLLILCAAVWVLGIFAVTDWRDLDRARRRHRGNLNRAPDVAWRCRRF